MTITVRVDPGSKPAVVVIDDEATGKDTVRVEPGATRDFHVYPGRTVTVAELSDDGAGERPVDPEPSAPE